MEFEFRHIIIQLFVAVFLVNMANEATVSMQYIQSIYNEIEHSADTNHDLEDSSKTKIKIVEAIPEFKFTSNIHQLTSNFEFIDLNKQVFWISNPTPPPEIIG